MNTAGFPSNNVTDIALDGQGRTWVSTDWGLCLFENGGWSFFQTQNSGIPDNRLLCLDVDSLDRVWIGTLLNGVLVYDGTTWVNYTTQNSPLPDDQIKCITIDHRGWAWIGTFLGLVCYTGTEWRIYDESPTSYGGLQLNGQVIEDVAVRADGLVAIGTLNGGFHYLTDTSVAVHATYIDLFPDNSQLGVAIDTVAEERWMVTPSQGLLRQGGSWENGPWFQYSTGLSTIPSNALISIAMDAQGRPWVGSMDKGLIVREPNGTFASYDTLNSDIPHNTVEVVKVASDGAIWVGTPFAGAARFQPTDMIVENSGAPALRLFPVPADDHVTIIWPHEAMGFRLEGIRCLRARSAGRKRVIRIWRSDRSAWVARRCVCRPRVYRFANGPSHCSEGCATSLTLLHDMTTFGIFPAFIRTHSDP